MRCERQSGQPTTRRHCHSPVNVPHVAFKAEWQCDRHARGRVAVRSVRSGPSGSEGMGSGHARGRVAVRPGLPNGRERTKSVRSMPSGSAIGTLGAEWQCNSHCHSMVNVLRITFKAEWQCNRYARGRVAVKGWDLGTLGAEWQCDVHCHSMVNVPRVAFKAEWQCDRYARGRVAVQSVRSGPSGSASHTATRW